MATVIDALVVTLTLDPAEYKRSWKDVEDIDTAGQKKREKVDKQNDKEAKERARREKQDALDRKKRTDELTGSIASLGRTVAGAFLGFETLEGGIKYLGALNEGQANLGRTAVKIGVGADALNIYGKAVEFAGGKAEDATETFAKLSQEKTFKDMRGEIGPLLQLLQQKGVAYEDQNGKLLDQGKILDELSRKTRNMKDQDRAALFAAAGISGGVINRMLEAQALQDTQLQKAREFNAVNAQSVKDAQDLQEAWRGVGQAVDHAGNIVLKKVTPATKDALTAVTKILSGDVKGANYAAGDAILDVGQLYADYTKFLYGGIAKAVFGGTDTPSAAAAAAPASLGLVAPKPGSLAARNNNPGNLEDKQGKFRQFATLAEGQAAMRADIEAKIRKGFETIQSILTRYAGTDGKKDPYALKAYIDRAVKLTGKKSGDKLTAADLPALLNAMTIVESGLPDSAMRRTPSGATPSAAVASGKIDRSGKGGGNTTTVNVEKIEVNSSNADPTAVANQTGDALQRKITVAQANAGQS